jgi:glycosyltransferase involved in cell wall biosynthesis
MENVRGLDERFATLRGAWLHYMCRARRMGFRCAVANRAVVERVCADPPPDGENEDFWRLHRVYQDAEMARREVADLPSHQYESLLARAGHEDASIRQSLLIDATGVGPCFNGTSHAALAILRGLEALDSGWRFTVLAKPESIRFHNLHKQFPGSEVTSSVRGRYFTAALRLCQPWDLETIFALHRLALFNFYLMLDTISWDVLYNGGLALQWTWRFLAEHADGILYISGYTQKRFRARFPLRGHDFVSHLSLHPMDYVTEAGLNAGPAAEPYILVVGNELDHKHVAGTLEQLAAAFPFQRFKALGWNAPERSANIEGLPSGLVPDEDIERLYAQARIIVFPSFYEGFGFPVLKGLSYNRAVVTRHSELVEEVAARYRGPGLLYAYERPWELVELLGELLSGQGGRPMALGSALEDGQEPMRWRDISRRMLERLECWTRTPGAARWRERHAAMEYAVQYREQTG